MKLLSSLHPRRTAGLAFAALACWALPLGGQTSDTQPGVLEIRQDATGPVLRLPAGPPTGHLVESSSDLVNWEPYLYGMTPGGEAVLPRPQGGAAWFRTRLAENAADECGTWEEARTSMNALMAGMQEGCSTFGEPDVPAVRDSHIPDADTPVKTVRLRFHLTAETNGSNPASSPAQVALMVDALNRQYGPHRIQFSYSVRTVANSAYRAIATNSPDAMKSALAESPATQMNIFVTRLNGGVAGVGTFPWSSDALQATGGIIVTDEASGVFVPDRTILGHEIGHCLGLWHTHHGVSEVTTCSTCYETPGGSNRDVTGDFCADTPATPVAWGCLQPPGNDPCSNTPWGNVDLRNIMSYSSCSDRFTPQQAGRMHGWIQHRLTGWLTAPVAAGPAAPSSIQATATASGVNVTWQDNSADETGFELQKSLDGVFFNPLTVTASNAVSFSDSTVPAGTTTWFRIRTQRNAERSAWVNSAPVVRPATASPPAAPSRLVLSPPAPPGRPGVRLQWSDNSIDETGFEIERAPAGGTFSALTTTPAGNSGFAIYEDSAITLGSAYTYRVRAAKGALRSAWTPAVSVHTLAAVLPAPSGLSLSITSTGNIRVEWQDNSSAETGFQIQRSPNGVNWTLLTTAPANNDTAARIVDSAITAGAVYYYRVQAILGSLESGWSEVRTATVPAAPAAPSAFSLSVTSTNNIRVQWNDNSSDETGFEIQRSADSGAWGVIAFASANSDTTARIVDSDVTPGHTYSYRGRTLRGVLASAVSAAASLTLEVAPLAAPTLTSPADNAPAAPRAPLLQWSGVAGAASWQVEIENISTGNLTRTYPDGTSVPTLTGTSLQVPAAGHLRSEKDFRWHVRALDSAGRPGAWSGWFRFTTRLEAPTLAVLLTPANGAASVSVNPVLDWDADDDSTHHYVQVRRDSPTGTLVIDEGPYFGESFYVVPEAQTLTSEKVYFWRVKDSTTAGASNWTGWFSFTTVQLPPTNAPTPLNPSAGESTIVTRPFFKWEALNRASSYRLRIIRASDGAVVKNYAGITGTEFRAEDGDGLEPNTNYQWEIRGVNDAGPGPWCPRVSFHTRP